MQLAALGYPQNMITMAFSTNEWAYLEGVKEKLGLFTSLLKEYKSKFITQGSHMSVYNIYIN